MCFPGVRVCYILVLSICLVTVYDNQLLNWALTSQYAGDDRVLTLCSVAGSLTTLSPTMLSPSSQVWMELPSPAGCLLAS